ncbi:MAG: NADH-quinone oxidoreductase subunit [Acidimicrobiia bacterium]|nr:NADH-quinone oxidoreductase subunit [Acidimicrobiia bacterium]
MDLKFSSDQPSQAERRAVDDLLGPPASGWSGGERAAGDRHVAIAEGSGRAANGGDGRRHLLLPVLHAVNDRVGWISPGAVNYVGQRLQVAPAEVYGVASFYDLFAFEPRPATRTLVCVDLACRIAAGGDVAVPPGSHASPCLGLCERAPATCTLGMDTAQAVADGSPEMMLPGQPPPEAAVPQAGDPSLVLLRRVGVVNPASLDDYRAQGGYVALRRAMSLGPNGVIRELTDSGLVGRGGAAFPAGRKWAAVAAQPARPHELVCNADESEPGTFKDRVLLEADPFSLIEAMTIAGWTVGAERGYLYLRGEYEQALVTFEAALAVARSRGVLGPDVMGLGFPFDIEVRRGAGAYICGEETAIFNSIEGFRGEPRNKPPFPVEVGLFGRPTLVNNVETLVNVLPILMQGGPAFAATGSGTSTGTKLFAVSGSVGRPGVYEVPFGVTARELIDLAGGVSGTLQAVLLGGAAGTFLGPDQLDMPLTFEAARAAGVTLGSGVVMVLNDSVDLGQFLVRIATFFRHESCGQCVPCRLGTVRQEEVTVRLASGRGRALDRELLDDLAAAMRDASICGLGQTAPSAIQSAMTTLGAFR